MWQITYDSPLWWHYNSNLSIYWRYFTADETKACQINEWQKQESNTGLFSSIVFLLFQNFSNKTFHMEEENKLKEIIHNDNNHFKGDEKYFKCPIKTTWLSIWCYWSLFIWTSRGRIQDLTQARQILYH